MTSSSPYCGSLTCRTALRTLESITQTTDGAKCDRSLRRLHLSALLELVRNIAGMELSIGRELMRLLLNLCGDALCHGLCLLSQLLGHIYGRHFGLVSTLCHLGRSLQEFASSISHQGYL